MSDFSPQVPHDASLCTASAPERLDGGALDALFERGGAALVVKMIELSTRTMQERMASAREAHDGGDAETLRWAAHSLKSSAGILGATRLREVAAALEAAAPHGGEECTRLLGQLEWGFPGLLAAVDEARERFGG